MNIEEVEREMENEAVKGERSGGRGYWSYPTCH